MPLQADMHSHLLPGLDDGVKSFWEAEAILVRFMRLGFRKIITTPHIMQDHYRNTPTSILGKLDELRNHLRVRNIPIQIGAAAEYHLDEQFVALLEANEPLLTFGDNYLLFETNFVNEPLNLRETIFLITTHGYTPVLAHPERYLYLINHFDKVQDLIDRGVLLQINIGSIMGLYGKPIQSFVEKLIRKGYVHFLGTDCHNENHAAMLEKVQKLRHYRKALRLPLLNNSL
jgi:tyrosine-protein phosphatase YwqE